MAALDELRTTTARLNAADAELAAARAERDRLIIDLALNTHLTYEQIAEAAGLTISGVWKVTTRAGISRQRVQVA